VDGRLEDLAEVEVDRPDRSMEVDRLVEQEPRVEEALKRGDARLEQRQPPLRDEGVSPQPLDVDPDANPREEGVALDVVDGCRR